jgi:hypothetical protein
VGPPRRLVPFQLGWHQQATKTFDLRSIHAAYVATMQSLHPTVCVCAPQEHAKHCQRMQPPCHYPPPLCAGPRAPLCPEATPRPARSPPSSLESRHAGELPHRRCSSSSVQARVCEVATPVRRGPRVLMVRTLSPIAWRRAVVSHAKSRALHAPTGAPHVVLTLRVMPRQRCGPALHAFCRAGSGSLVP